MFSVDPLVEPITDEELNKEVFMESTTVSSTTITDDQLNREVNSESTVQTKMPEFTNPTKTTKHRQTTTQIPPSTIDTWKEMTPESATKFTPITTKSPLLRNKMAPVFLDYSNRRNKPVRIEAFNAKGNFYLYAHHNQNKKEKKGNGNFVHIGYSFFFCFFPY